MKTQTTARPCHLSPKRYASRQIRKLSVCTVQSDASRHWHALHEVLHALPLGTDQFATVINRYRNALRYFLQGETGAARYELDLLRGGLC